MIYSEAEINILREGGKRLAYVLGEVAKKTVPGVKIFELNDYAEKLILEGGDTPAFLNYKPEGSGFPYPASLCVSVNEGIVHGISNGNSRVLKDGDVVGLDLGLRHNGFVTDMAVTVGVGKVDNESRKLIEATKQALYEGIGQARAGNTTGDIGHAVAEFGKKARFNVAEDLGGHGVGKNVHEEPFIPNFGRKGSGDKLRSGMVLAIEPMLNAGTKRIVLDDDGYTFNTADGKKSAHFEHTILITNGEPEILTKI